MAVRSDPLQMSCRRYRFGQRLLRVTLFVEPLTLQVAELDIVAVDHDKMANAGTRQRAGLEGTQRAAAGDRNAGLKQPDLPLFADVPEPNLARVTLGLVRSHTTRW